MKSFKDIENLIKDSRVQATAATDERILQTVQESLTSSDSSESTEPAQHSQVPSWLKVAAVLLFGLGLFSIWFPGHTSFVPESIAVADIQQAIALHQGVFITGQRHCVFPARGDRPEVSFTYKTEKWATEAGYIDNTLEQDGTPVMQFCYDFKSGTVTIVYFFGRQYYRFAVPEAYRQHLSVMTPLGLIDQLFQANAQPLPLKNIQDRPAFGFATTELSRRIDENLSPQWLRYYLFNITKSEAELWVDAETKLPALMHGHFTLDNCLFSDFETMHWEEISDQWHWGANLNTLDLHPTMPVGYTPMAIPGL